MNNPKNKFIENPCKTNQSLDARLSIMLHLVSTREMNEVAKKLVPPARIELATLTYLQEPFGSIRVKW